MNIIPYIVFWPTDKKYRQLFFNTDYVVFNRLVYKFDQQSIVSEVHNCCIAILGHSFKLVVYELHCYRISFINCMDKDYFLTLYVNTSFYLNSFFSQRCLDNRGCTVYYKQQNVLLNNFSHCF